MKCQTHGCKADSSKTVRVSVGQGLEKPSVGMDLQLCARHADWLNPEWVQNISIGWEPAQPSEHAPRARQE